MTDARIEATRRRLREAIFTLATTKDIGAVSVAELTRTAGIDRTTFYLHAGSPTELLTTFLAEELDPLRVSVEETLDSDPDALAAVGAELNARLVDHVEQYADVYADHGDGRINSALHAALAAHTVASLQHVFTHLAEAGVEVAGTAEERRYLAAFVGSGVVGVIAIWLAEPAPRDRARLEAALAPVYSGWLVPAATRKNNEGDLP